MAFYSKIHDIEKVIDTWERKENLFDIMYTHDNLIEKRYWKEMIDSMINEFVDIMYGDVIHYIDNSENINSFRVDDWTDSYLLCRYTAQLDILRKNKKEWIYKQSDACIDFIHWLL
jgi:hypothetical protein